MTDQNIFSSTINLRSKGITQASGKLCKGCVKDATTKLSIGSIPSTYESIIYKTDHKKAFGTSQKRFYDKQNNPMTRDTNCEDLSTAESAQVEARVNYNRLGQNSFISKQKREWIRCAQTPGPTHYNSSPAMNRACFSQQSQKKMKVLKKYEEKEVKMVDVASPGPGEYIFDRKEFWETSNKGWKSSFETKVNRDGYIPEKLSPGPGYYQLLTQPTQKNKDTQDKEEDKVNDKNILREILRENKFKEPGPCSYNQQIPTFKPLYQRIKMSGNFMMPINSCKKRNKGTPAPTAYHVKRMYQDMKPKLIESTFFMSETKRDPFVKKQGAHLSPLNPDMLGHKNFHFNIKNDWVC